MSSPAQEYERRIEAVVDRVGIYPRDAFLFVQAALQFTVQQLGRSGDDKSPPTHVSGQELCEGIRQLSLQRWGLMARTVLRSWGITRTADFGNIVYAMIDAQLASKTDEDSIDDFSDVYDFVRDFEQGYRMGSEASAPEADTDLDPEPGGPQA
ncbi:MAG TPA: hypothetical protein PKC18_09665 [Lacipirellulaceae bacterium]|nr:hypothetical protein [Lacipirellulaceae bacterium]